MRLLPASRPLAHVVADGEPVYVASSGAAFRGLRADNVGNGLIVFRDATTGVRIEDIEVEGGYRVIENSAPKGKSADCVGLIVRRARAAGLVRGFARIRYASRDGVIEDVSASCAGSVGAHDLPVGIAFADQAHDFRVERCTMRGFQWKRGDKRYWNGDGYSAERGNRRLIFRRCAAWDNSDGGFDLKSTETLLDDCVSGRNARNYRLWSSIRATQLTSLDPVKVGGIGDTNHISIMGPKAANAKPIEIRIGHLIARAKQAAPIFDIYDGPVRIIVDSHEIDVPAGTPLVRMRGKGAVIGGITFRSGAPKL